MQPENIERDISGHIDWQWLHCTNLRHLSDGLNNDIKDELISRRGDMYYVALRE